MRILNPFVGLVSRVPARVQAKLLAAFLAIAMLLIIVGAASLYVLSGVNERTEELVKLQRKIEAYRQVQHDMTSQLYSVASALISSDPSATAGYSARGSARAPHQSTGQQGRSGHGRRYRGEHAGLYHRAADRGRDRAL
jgi:HAMP domain-containing protein